MPYGEPREACRSDPQSCRHQGGFMQGIIFTALSDMVIERLGIEVWDQLLDEAQLPSQGVYTSGGRYDDTELLRLVGLLTARTGIPAPDLVRSFGEFLFAKLYASLPPNLQQCTDLRQFLLAIDGTIHKEVKRVYPDSYLPSFVCDDSNPQQLTMQYRSMRQLCHAAEGLIAGAAVQFGSHVSIEHPVCMHQGAEHCTLIVKFDTAKASE